MSGSAPGTLGLEATRRGLDEVAEAVGLAQRTVRNGDLVDLTGLERRVDDLCAAIRALPQADGRSLEPQLLGLIDDLTTLTDALRRQSEQTRIELGETSSHSAAAAAYRKQQR